MKWLSFILPSIFLSSLFYASFRTRKCLSLHFTKNSERKKSRVKNLRMSPLSYSVCLEVNTKRFLRIFGNQFVSTHVSAVFRRKLQRFTQFPEKITQNYERCRIYTNSLARSVRKFEVRVAPTWFQADLGTNLYMHWEIPCCPITQWPDCAPTHCKGSWV